MDGLIKKNMKFVGLKVNFIYNTKRKKKREEKRNKEIKKRNGNES